MDGGLHNISRADAVGVVGGRVMMRDGAIRLSDGIELVLRHGTREVVRTGVPMGLSNGVIEIGLRLGTREGVRLSVPLEISNRIELGLRLGTEGRLCDELHCYSCGCEWSTVTLASVYVAKWFIVLRNSTSYHYQTTSLSEYVQGVRVLLK